MFNLMIDLHVMAILATRTLRERGGEREGGGGGERKRERKASFSTKFFCLR